MKRLLLNNAAILEEKVILNLKLEPQLNHTINILLQRTNRYYGVGVVGIDETMFSSFGSGSISSKQRRNRWSFKSVIYVN